MQFSNEINLALTIISGLCWTLVYLLIIYRSIKDKTYGMPFWALAFNISWEFIFSVVFASTPRPSPEGKSLAACFVGFACAIRGRSTGSP